MSGQEPPVVPVSQRPQEATEWWRSRRIIGLLVLAVGVLRSITGWKWLDEHQADLVLTASLEVVGLVVAWWGAVKATGPVVMKTPPDVKADPQGRLPGIGD